MTTNTFPGGELDHAVEIGAITDQSVRVWVRQPGQSVVRGWLEVTNQPPVTASTTISDETDWTGAIEFTLPEPAPGAPFTCKVNGTRREGYLAPSPGERAGFSFGFGSCNHPFELEDGRIRVTEAAGIYRLMAADLARAEARFLLLCGDQLYSDEIDPISVRENITEDDLPGLDEEIDAYRHITRGYFAQRGFRKLRERFPTYCIWDDHDIFDNWGSRQTESDLDRRLFEAATRAYGEYQHQRNPGGAIGLPPFHYTFQYGTAAFLILDVRGKRDWRTGQILGEEQWRDVIRYLRESPEEVETLFVISSIPFAHTARWVPWFFDHLPGHMLDSIRDRWPAAAFVEQRDALLRELFDWQARGPVRQIAILSGDVHVAGAFTIRERGGPGVIEQFISSAFTTPLPPIQRLYNMTATRGSNLMEPRWHFERHFLIYQNNYGLVRLTPLPTGGHNIEFLVRTRNRRTNRPRTSGRRSISPRRT